MLVRDSGIWRATWIVEKWREDGVRPYETRSAAGNLLVYGGASALWEQLIASGAVTAFNAANAHLGVGDSSAAAVNTQTDLQAVTNKARRVMDGGYPAHTDGTGAASNADCEWRATFGSGTANFAWNEAGLFNAASGGRMLNRKGLTGFGTKSAGQTWSLRLIVTLA